MTLLENWELRIENWELRAESWEENNILSLEEGESGRFVVLV